MLENNTFRVMMLVAALMLVGMLFASWYKIPMIPIDSAGVVNYNNVMSEEIDSDTSRLTPNQAFQFTIEAKGRSHVRHY